MCRLVGSGLNALTRRSGPGSQSTVVRLARRRGQGEARSNSTFGGPQPDCVNGVGARCADGRGAPGRGGGGSTKGSGDSTRHGLDCADAALGDASGRARLGERNVKIAAGPATGRRGGAFGFLGRTAASAPSRVPTCPGSRSMAPWAGASNAAGPVLGALTCPGGMAPEDGAGRRGSGVCPLGCGACRPGRRGGLGSRAVPAQALLSVPLVVRRAATGCFGWAVSRLAPRPWRPSSSPRPGG